MDDVIEISGLESACRLCLTTEQSRSPIFGLPDTNVPFAEKIRVCLSIQVKSDDKLSTLVCTSCIKNINHWHSYKDTCLKAQEKLNSWLAKRNSILPVVTIKEEPEDADYENDTMQIVQNESTISNHIGTNEDETNVNECDITSATRSAPHVLPDQSSEIEDRMDTDLFTPEVQIKTEPMDTEDEDDCNIDIESVNSGELLINPMAVGVSNSNSDRVMEADSTKKSTTRRFLSKKKMRRGPHTHYRGIRIFKKKCVHCKIFLHSKYSYTQHMSKFHGIVSDSPASEFNTPVQPPANNQKSKLLHYVDDTESDINAQNESNPEDAEFEKMITSDSLTPVQKTIISQLKTFSCYSCKRTFTDRRDTLNHIRYKHMPDLRPFTCIACFTEFSDRVEYQWHCSESFECAMKIALVVPKIGQEKYFTCNLCLKVFNNRRGLLTHLALHADNQIPKPVRPAPNTVSTPTTTTTTTTTTTVVKPDSSPIKRAPPPGPYMNGDPAHNHMCDLCGMIYRYKPNMIKHRELCMTLPDDIRTSYRCVQCSMTYLVYKKFYTHVFYEHKKREITCFTCHAKFPTADDYLNHHETHRDSSNKEAGQTQQQLDDQQEQTESSYLNDQSDLNSSSYPTDAGEKSFNCALCNESFATKFELSEHRNLHLKVKIYSCVICRSMFSSSGALEVHMKEHGIDDASEQAGNSSVVEYSRANNSLNDSLMSAVSDPGNANFHCRPCNRNFSNYANLKRHERNLHTNQQRRRWSCNVCKRRFKSAESHDEHVRGEHGLEPEQEIPPYTKQVVRPPTTPLSSPAGKPLMQCPKCPKTFAYQGNLIQHCQNVHKENHFERVVRQAVPVPRPPAPVVAAPAQSPRPRIGHTCDLCGKTFREAQSLKTHRGWHLRTNYRLKVDQNASLDERMLSGQGYQMTSPPKQAKARKSFPNNPPPQQLNNIGNLQCQVCDDRFSDVGELRNHLWDVHCARNKPEKTFVTDLQCELCTNKFPDQQALREHMKWHAQNPILSNNRSSNFSSASKDGSASTSNAVVTKKMFQCDVCGKYYSNRKMFLRHKKLHKIVAPATIMNLQSLQSSRRHFCHACQKNFATDTTLRRHKASPCHMNMVRMQVQAPAKKITTTAIVHQPPPEMSSSPLGKNSVKNEPEVDFAAAQSSASQPMHVQQAMKKKPVTCHICKTIFPNMSVLYQHKQLVHRVPPGGGAVATVARPFNATLQSPKAFVPQTSAEGMVSCNVCGKQFPRMSQLKLHFAHKHKNKPASFPCTAPGCKLVFSSNSSLKNHENTHTNMIYNCQLCDRHVFSKVAMTRHMLTMHKAIYQSRVSKNSLWTETDLTNYNVKNSQSTACPKCNVKYPNMKALKIHYFKFHDKA